MFKRIAFFALFLAVTGLFAATSVNAQRLVKGSLVKSASSTDTLLGPIPEAESANLDQCHNGGFSNGTSDPNDCTGSAWANGNANENNSHYVEDGHIRYRLGFSGLVSGQTYTVVIGYDRLQGADHAIDYLTTYDAVTPAASDPNGFDSDYTVTPCDDATPGSICTLPASTTDIPLEANMVPTHDTVEPGVFTLWGASFAACNPGCAVFVNPNGTTAEMTIAITFTAGTSGKAMLAWSGHIASRPDWTPETTAITDRSGSPYHMRLKQGIFGGQQDRSLKGSAVLLAPPSAADATVAGRVTDSYGRAIASAKLTLNDAITGEVKTAYTNTFGYYKFEGVPVGDFFVMSVSHRRYTFATPTVSFSLEDSIAGLNFQASR